VSGGPQARDRRSLRSLLPAGTRLATLNRLDRTFNRLGYRLAPYDEGVDPEMSARIKLFRALGIDLVIDVGANAGIYAQGLRGAGYRGRIVSFEPLSGAFAELEQASREDRLWECRQLALGRSDEESEIHVSENSYSSSLLEMKRRHLESAPESRYVGTERIQVRTLDSEWDSLRAREAPVCLKLDVQGYEMAVLDGAAASLPRVACVQSELSLVPLYEGAPSYREMIDRLAEEGLRLAGLERGHFDGETGELLQFDGIFIRD